jgi:ribonuclease Z
MTNFDVTILGSNSAISEHGRHPTAQVVNIASQLFLIDCGEGTQERLLEYKVKWFNIHHIFISHLHGDHYFGLIGLITTYNLLKRKQKLTIYAPSQLKDIVEIQLHVSNTILGYELVFVATKDDAFYKIFENELVEVFSFPLQHRIPTTGFLLKEKEGERKLQIEKVEHLDIEKTDYKLLKQGIDVADKIGNIIKAEDVTGAPNSIRSYAFCSDTMFDESIVKYIKDVDLLYHEATYLHNSLERAIQTKHSTALQAAQIAKQANAKKLIIGHFSSRYYHLSVLLDEAKTIFENVELAIEGKVFSI